MAKAKAGGKAAGHKRPARGTAKPPANFIRAWREFREIKTQGELAEKAGMTRATISRLESGALPFRQKALEQIAKALDCQPHDLIGTDPKQLPDIIKIFGIPERHREAVTKFLASLKEL